MQPAKTDGRNRSTANACAPSFHSAAESVALRILTQDSPETARLETINEVSFPECERNAISDLFASGRDGNLDMIGIYAGDALAGFFAVRKFRRIRYLAYFAVAPERRSEGIGSAAIRQLKMLYPDCQIVTEFEAPDPVHEIRRRRRDFYIRNGFYETGRGQTVFLPAKPHLTYVSSSVITDIAKHGGDISGFVPPEILQDILTAIKKEC